ncbi:granzyme A [Sigmodon hispidus]
MFVFLQLKTKATINKNVAILALPKMGVDVKPGTRCHVAGWGRFQNKSPPSPTLREVNITVIDRRICNDEKHYNFNPVIGLNMICAGNLHGGKDSCEVSEMRKSVLATRVRHMGVGGMTLCLVLSGHRRLQVPTVFVCLSVCLLRQGSLTM